MNTRLLLIAASTLALAACGSEVETAETETDEPVETALSEEQPPLEGDSPFVDGEDVADSRLDQENYDTGFDGEDLSDEDVLDEMDSEFAEAETDFDRATNNLIAESERIAADAEGELEEAERDIEMAANDMADDAERTYETAENKAEAAADSMTAKRYTAQETDAYIGDDGNLVTGSEAALLAGTYEVTLPNQSEPVLLYIEGEGNSAVGTFGGEPIEVSVTGRNFMFDAPVSMDGEEELMTFAGTFEDGRIDNGVLESQGDGTSLTFTAERIEDDE